MRPTKQDERFFLYSWAVFVELFYDETKLFSLLRVLGVYSCRVQLRFYVWVNAYDTSLSKSEAYA
jgi:hypothetical protein